MKYENSLFKELDGKNFELKIIGDALKPRKALYAKREGSAAAEISD